MLSLVSNIDKDPYELSITSEPSVWGGIGGVRNQNLGNSYTECIKKGPIMLSGPVGLEPLGFGPLMLMYSEAGN